MLLRENQLSGRSSLILIVSKPHEIPWNTFWKINYNPVHATGLFFTSWNHQKTTDFPIVSGGIERDQEMKWVKCTWSTATWNFIESYPLGWLFIDFFFMKYFFLKISIRVFQANIFLLYNPWKHEKTYDPLCF